LDIFFGVGFEVLCGFVVFDDGFLIEEAVFFEFVVFFSEHSVNPLAGFNGVCLAIGFDPASGFWV
jgi:hypothetical protein